MAKKQVSGKLKVNSKNSAGRSKNERQLRKEANSKALKSVLIILAVLVGLGLLFAGLKLLVPGLFGGASLSGKLAAEVNGQPITIQELDDGYAGLPYQYQVFLSKDDFLNQLIDQILLRQEAARQGIQVTDLDAEQNIQKFLVLNNISAETFQELIANKTIDYDELLQISKDQVLVQSVINLEVSSKINVTAEDALNYYNSNPDLFVVPGTMTVRHILIATLLSNRSENDSKALAEKIYSEVVAGKESFCDLVKKYSDDKASVELCGEYTFSKGELPEEFEQWAEKANMDDMSVLSTVYGSHVVWLVNKTPGSTILFRDVEDKVMATLAKEQERRLYQEFLSKVRNSSVIKKYYSTQVELETDSLNVDQDGASLEVSGLTPAENESTQASENAPANQDGAPAVTELPNAEAEDGAIMPSEEPNKEPTVPDETATVTAVSIKPAPVPAEPAVAVPVDYKACLLSKDAVLYGANWNSDTARQLKLLGDFAGKLKYVECAVAGDYAAKTAACQAEGIRAYPTWSISGKQFMGVYTLEELGQLAGC